MKPKTVGRPMRLSRKPPGPKAEVQSEELWGQQVSLLLKQVMDSRGWGFRQLSEQLATMGIDMTAPTVNRRINRGNFSAGFLLMCLEAMEARFEVRTDEPTPGQHVANRLPGSPIRVKKPVETLAAILGGWGTKKSLD